MADHLYGKKQTRLLCSKKEIILSRSLGTVDTRGQAEHFIVPQDGGKQDALMNISMLPYSKREREQDDAILNRFDNALGEFNTALKKRKGGGRVNSDKDSRATPPKQQKLQEIIEINSASTSNPNNNNHGTASTSSDIRHPKPPLQTYRRQKNTIPSDAFGNYLTSLKKKYPPMTKFDRVKFWKFEPTDDDNDDTQDKSASDKVSSKQTEKQKALRVDNNNERPCSVNGDCKQNVKTNENSEMEIYSYFSADKHTLETDVKKPDQTSNSTYRISPNDVSTSREYYPTPHSTKESSHMKNGLERSPISHDCSNHIVRYLTNKKDTTKKEEFYKYLGLETTSPNSKTEIVMTKTKRRSLRVRRMQLEKENNKKAKRVESCFDADEIPDDRNSIKSSHKISDLIKPIETQSELSFDPPTKQRRTCGSIVALSVDSPIPEALLNIVTRIDYASDNSKSKVTLVNSQESTEANYENPPQKKGLNEESTLEIGDDSGASTAFSRKNITCQVLEKLDIVDSKNDSSIVDDSQKEVIDESINCENVDVLTVGRNRQARQLSTPVATVISCIERVAYEKPGNNTNRTFDILKLEEPKNKNAIANDSKAVDSINKCCENEVKVDKTELFEDVERKSVSIVFTNAVENGEEDTCEPPLAVKNVLDTKAEPIEDVKDENSVTIETDSKLQENQEKSETDAKSSTNTKPFPPNSKLNSLTGNLTRKSIKSYRSNSQHQRLLRSKKRLKVLTKKLKIPVIESLINQKAAKRADDRRTLPGEIDLSTIPTLAKQQCNSSMPKYTETQIIGDRVMGQLSDQDPNLLLNPLNKRAGNVLHAYYVCDYLVVVQEFRISFWRYSKILRMLGVSQNWEFLGEHERNLHDVEVSTPYKNRLCVNEKSPVYVEMRARQLPDDPARQCNMTAVYVNVYFLNEKSFDVSRRCINLDTIKGLHSDILYTTITNSRYFVMHWKQENILNVTRTGFCKYSLTPGLDHLASIREFSPMRHAVLRLDCLDEDKLIGIGRTCITIWDHMTGDILINIDLLISLGDNLGSIYSFDWFQTCLFLYQARTNELTEKEELQLLAVNLSEKPNSFHIIGSHELSPSFSDIKSTFIHAHEMLVVTAADQAELLLFPQESNRFFQRKIANLERFYTTGSKYFVEVSQDHLNVKTVNELIIE